jgi:hypothetical protein
VVVVAAARGLTELRIGQAGRLPFIEQRPTGVPQRVAG